MAGSKFDLLLVFSVSEGSLKRRSSIGQI